MGLSLPGLALAHQLYVAVKAQGHGRLGTHSLMLALETMNGELLLCVCVCVYECVYIAGASSSSRVLRVRD